MIWSSLLLIFVAIISKCLNGGVFIFNCIFFLLLNPSSSMLFNNLTISVLVLIADMCETIFL
ncbi:hypothetical protein AYY20_03715 [Photobacterium aquimaris]|nr:hypothetical protein AYY20_03715 [Photobacterium aquimaris]